MLTASRVVVCCGMLWYVVLGVVLAAGLALTYALPFSQAVVFTIRYAPPVS